MFARTARLPRVEIRKPARTIGTTTVGSLQSGLYFGYLGLVDGILQRLLDEMGEDTTILATGGLAALIGKGSKYIKHVDEFLTLDGLRIIWERNALGKAHGESSSSRESAPAAGSPRPGQHPLQGNCTLANLPVGTAPTTLFRRKATEN